MKNTVLLLFALMLTCTMSAQPADTTQSIMLQEEPRYTLSMTKSDLDEYYRLQHGSGSALQASGILSLLGFAVTAIGGVIAVTETGDVAASNSFDRSTALMAIGGGLMLTAPITLIVSGSKKNRAARMHRDAMVEIPPRK